LFRRESKSCKNLHDIKFTFILENKSCGSKSNPKQIPKSCGPRQSQILGQHLGGSFASPSGKRHFRKHIPKTKVNPHIEIK